MSGSVKNQYFGDVNDYAKYGMLRALGEQLTIAVIWMLTPDDGSRDGRKTEYLESGRIGDHDPELFAWLTRWYREGAPRDLRLIEESGLLPSCRFFGEGVPSDAIARADWFDRAREFARGADLVFLDPDNGLPVTSVKPGSGGWSKYIGWKEIEALSEDGHALFIYQHLARVKRRDFINSKLRELYVRLGVDHVTTFNSFNWIGFLIDPRHDHIVELSDAVHRITTNWHHRINVSQNVIVPMAPDEAAEGERKRAAAFVPRQMRPKSTDVGYVNKNDQEVLNRTDRPGSDHLQRVYILRCRRCGAEYGANGTDIWIRKCPFCQGGKPGL